MNKQKYKCLPLIILTKFCINTWNNLEHFIQSSICSCFKLDQSVEERENEVHHLSFILCCRFDGSQTVSWHLFVVVGYIVNIWFHYFRIPLRKIKPIREQMVKNSEWSDYVRVKNLISTVQQPQSGQDVQKDYSDVRN